MVRFCVPQTLAFVAANAARDSFANIGRASGGLIFGAGCLGQRDMDHARFVHPAFGIPVSCENDPEHPARGASQGCS